MHAHAADGAVAVVALAAGPERLSVLMRRVHLCWSGKVEDTYLAERFALGRVAKLSDGPVARGKQGLVWRLDTAGGSWAVKVPFRRTSEEQVRVATEFQEAAFACGVPAPQVCRTAEGQVIAEIAG